MWGAEAMRRILRTVPTYFPYVSGPANQVRAVSSGLRPLGFETRIITTTAHAPGAPVEELIDGSPVLRLPVQAGVLQYQIARGAWQAIHSYPADLIHVHSYRNFLADVAAISAARRNIPLVMHLHGSLASYKTIVPAGRRWLYSAFDLVTSPLPTLRAQAFVVSTRAEADEAAAYGLDPARLHVIPMGIDHAAYQLRDTPRDPRQILMVGRLCQDRNVELLLVALAQLRELPWRCTIVGGEERRSYTERPGYLERLRRLAGELDLADRVVFAGPLGGRALREAYAQAGVFVYTSLWENFGQALLEAAAAGCALVSTRVGVAPDLIEDGASGFCLDAPAPTALAARLRELLANPQLPRRMGERARTVAREGYDWQAILQRYSELYTTLLGDGRTWRRAEPAAPSRRSAP